MRLPTKATIVKDMDAIALSGLCKKALRTRTQTQFAEQAGLSLNIVNKLCNCKLPARPHPETLYKVYETSNGEVDFSSLMDAAGYCGDYAEEFFADRNKERNDEDTTSEPWTEHISFAIEKCLALIEEKKALVVSLQDEINRLESVVSALSAVEQKTA